MATPHDSPANESRKSTNELPIASNTPIAAATLYDVSSMLDVQCRVTRYEDTSNPIDRSMSEKTETSQQLSAFPSFASLPSRAERKRALPPANTPPKRACSDGSGTVISSDKSNANHSWPPFASYQESRILACGSLDYTESTTTETYDPLHERNDSDEMFGMSHDEYLSGIERSQHHDVRPTDAAAAASSFGQDTFASMWASSVQPDDRMDSQPTAPGNLDATTTNLASISSAIGNLKDDRGESGASSDHSDSSNARFSPSDCAERVYIDEREITDLDVLCGREFSASDHPGNLEYLRMIAKYKARYDSFGSKHGKKTQIRNLIVDTLVQKGGRFVARAANERQFYLLAKDEARHKVSQCLREKRNNKSKKKKSKKSKKG